MRELELIERSMMKTLLAIYHGRIKYPTVGQIQAERSGVQASSTGAVAPAAKSA